MKQDNSYKNIVKNIAGILLLGLYLWAILFPSMHKLLEHTHDDNSLCVETEAEQDPCHQKVYHQNSKSGCQHNAHLHKPKHLCMLCDVLLTPTHYFNKVTTYSLSSIIVFNDKPISTQVILNIFCPSISLRGPPQM